MNDIDFKDYNRQLKVLYMSPEFLTYLFIQQEINLLISGMPNDFIIKQVYFDKIRDCFALVIYSKKFETVELGALLPELEVTLTLKNKRKRKLSFWWKK